MINTLWQSCDPGKQTSTHRLCALRSQWDSWLPASKQPGANTEAFLLRYTAGQCATTSLERGWKKHVDLFTEATAEFAVFIYCWHLHVEIDHQSATVLFRKILQIKKSSFVIKKKGLLTCRQWCWRCGGRQHRSSETGPSGRLTLRQRWAMEGERDGWQKIRQSASTSHQYIAMEHDRSANWSVEGC